jgi:hypothetical protein
VKRFRPLRAFLAGACSAVILALALVAGLVRDARALDAHAAELAGLVALAAFLAGGLALLMTDLVAGQARRSVRAAVAATLVLVFGVPGLVGVYGVHFALNAYGELEGDAFGLWRFAFVGVQGMAYFVIFGFRLLAPWGILAVASVAWIAAPRLDVTAPEPPAP